MSSSENLDSNNYKKMELEERELDFKLKELENKKAIEILRIIVTGFVVTLIPAIINYQIQQQKIEIEKLAAEREYLQEFSDDVVKENDLIKRRNFVEYVATIAQSKSSRDRWKEYLKIISVAAEKQEEITKEFDQKTAELYQKIEAGEISEEKIVQLKKELELKEAELKALIEQNKLKTFEVSLDKKELIKLTQDTYSLIKNIRRSAVSELVKPKWKPYHSDLVYSLLELFEENPNNYFGIVNTLFILDTVDVSLLKNSSNQAKVKSLLDQGGKLLNSNDKRLYRQPIIDKLK